MAASAKRILIVDDEREVAEALSEYLAVRGYAVETAADGPEALVRRAAGPTRSGPARQAL
jgi:CheY-like chemotaxis protein